jgi:hypothetical protein
MLPAGQSRSEAQPYPHLYGSGASYLSEDSAEASRIGDVGIGIVQPDAIEKIDGINSKLKLGSLAKA